MNPLQWLGVILLWFFPVLICALAIWRWRGGWRLAPIIPLTIMVPLLAIDVNSAIHGGNLTGIMTILAYVISLPILLLLAVAQGFATRHERQQSPAATYTMAALSSVFLFAGVLFFWFALLLFPLGIQFGQIGMVLYWIVGGAVALAVAVYSFRAAVKRQAIEEPVSSSTEAVESSCE
jgi:hypothetical protein